MSKEHTPAPWFNDGFRIYAPTDSADKRSGRVIAYLPLAWSKFLAIEEGFNPADAALIAAAPDMLQALEFVKNFLLDLEHGCPADDPLTRLRKRHHAPAHAALDLAIGKAKNERT